MALTCPEGHTTTSTDYCDVCGTPLAQGAPASGPADAPGGDAPAAPASAPCPNCHAENPPDSLFCEACGYDYTTGALPRGQEAPPAGGAEQDAGDSLAPGSGRVAGGSGGAGEAKDAGGADAAAAASLLDLDAPLAPDAPAAPDAPGAPVQDASSRGASSQGAGAGSPAPQPPAPPSPAPPSPAAEIPVEWVAEVWVDPEWYAVQQPPDPMPSPGLPTLVPLRRRSLLIGRASRSRGITPDIDCEPDSGTSRRQAQLTTDGSRWFVEDLDSANGTYVAPAAGPLPRTPIAQGRRHELAPGDRLYLGAWTRIVLRRATPDELAQYA